MSQFIKITGDDIVNQVKLSCQIPEIVEQIIARKIMINAATESDIKVETEEIQKVADQMRLANKLTTVDATFAWLEKHSLSVDDFESIAYHSLIAEKLATHLFADKVEPYFFENQLDYARAVIYEVILDDEDLALELFYAIQEDEMTFHNVACKYIQDTELRRQGGYKGKVLRKDLKPEISAAVFAANPPQLIKPIMTSQGVHLIFVEELLQPELNKKLYLMIILDLFSIWIKQQINQFEIVVNLE